MVIFSWYSRRHTTNCSVKLPVSTNSLATLQTRQSKAVEIGSLLIRSQSGSAISGYLLFRNVCPSFRLFAFQNLWTSWLIFMEFYEIFQRLQILVKLCLNFVTGFLESLHLSWRDAVSSDRRFWTFRRIVKSSWLCNPMWVTSGTTERHSIKVSHCHSVTSEKTQILCHTLWEPQIL